MCSTTPEELSGTPSLAKAQWSASNSAMPSGFQRRRRMVEVGLVLLSICYGVFLKVDLDVDINPIFCEGEQGYQAEGGGCRRPDLVAYKITSLVAMTTMGVAGVYHWYFSAPLQAMASKGTTPEDRLFRHLEASDFHNACSIIYQLWDLCISLTIPEHADPIFLTHHTLALLTAYFSLEYQLVGYYSVFYGGVSEFSSIFLIFIDKDAMILVEEGSLLDHWVLLCKVLFFITFTLYRIVGWIGHSFPLWRDCSAVFRSGSADKLLPGRTIFIRWFQAVNLLLGALQCYWWVEIAGTAAKFLGF